MIRLLLVLFVLVTACADVAASARIQARASSAASVDLGAAAGGAGGMPPTASGGASSSAGEAGAAAGGAGGMPSTASGGASSSAGAAGETGAAGGAGGSGGATAADPCAAPVLIAGAPLPAGPWRLSGREWRVFDNPQALPVVPLPCSPERIEVDPFCRSSFPVLVEVCP